MKRLSLCAVVLCIAFVCAESLSVRAQDPPAGTATGQKIGTIVKTAINTALPGITDLVNLFWKKPDADKQTKAELTAAVTAAQKELRAKVQVQLKPVAAVVSELQVLGRFMEPTTKAHEAVIQMQTRATLDKSDWDVAKAQLDTIKGIADTDIDRVRDLWLRNTLKQIKGVNNTLVIRIAAEVAKPMPDRAVFLPYLGQLESALSTITLAVGYEISDLQADLKDLSDFANAAAGGPVAANRLTPDQRVYMGRIKSNLDSLAKNVK